MVHKVAANGWGFVQWPIRDPGSRAAKSHSWIKFLFLDQISKWPCQPDMSLGFILSMSIYLSLIHIFSSGFGSFTYSRKFTLRKRVFLLNVTLGGTCS